MDVQRTGFSVTIPVYRLCKYHYLINKFSDLKFSFEFAKKCIQDISSQIHVV